MILRRLARWAGVLVAIYVVAYIVFRVVYTQVWNKDKQAYVIFPERPILIFYAFRPLTYLGGAMTGMRFHIGPQ